MNKFFVIFALIAVASCHLRGASYTSDADAVQFFEGMGAGLNNG